MAALVALRKARDAGITQLNRAAQDHDLPCLHDAPKFKRLLEGAESKT